MQYKFPNDCNHKKEEFYGTVIVDEKEVDLYFFYDKLRGWEYCMRYGELGEYSSFPVDLLFNFIQKGRMSEKDFVIVSCFIDHMNKLKGEFN